MLPSDGAVLVGELCMEEGGRETCGGSFCAPGYRAPGSVLGGAGSVACMTLAEDHRGMLVDVPAAQNRSAAVACRPIHWQWLVQKNSGNERHRLSQRKTP